MATLKDLEKYLQHEFSTGSTTGEDYKTFQTKYINFLRSICKERNWELTNVGKNHYCFSAFIKSNENKFIYLSISDVRFFENQWYNKILYRAAKSDKDYTGGANQYTTLPFLQNAITNLLNRKN